MLSPATRAQVCWPWSGPPFAQIEVEIKFWAFGGTRDFISISIYSLFEGGTNLPEGPLSRQPDDFFKLYTGQSSSTAIINILIGMIIVLY